MNIASIYKRTYDRIYRLVIYCWSGVWRDPSKSLKVKIIKILNLSVRTFLDSELQNRAAALTFRTLLAIVPAFALLFAIGRGFNLQDLLQSQLYQFFPAQHKAFSTAFSFVDSYLKQSAQGVFVGVGIVFLLWTLISLLSHIEDNFNRVWGVKQGRTFYRKITDYTAVCLLIPILMLCSAGINIFMSTMFDTLFGHSVNSPVISFILDCAPFLLTCVAFTLSFMIIPNTKVNLKYASISGIICGIAFQIIQLLFISGQVYVAKYNAIYGSFAFLPLLLIWLQISWLILLFGCTLTYSMQNIFHFTFTERMDNVSPQYMRKLILATAAVIAVRFARGLRPCTVGELSAKYGLPIRMVTDIVDKLHTAGVVFFVVLPDEAEGVAPAFNVETYTVRQLMETMNAEGDKGFVPEFDRRYKSINRIMEKLAREEYSVASDILLKDLEVPNPR